MDDSLTEIDCLGVSALTKAALLSPYVHEVTIGPNSTYDAENYAEENETAHIVASNYEKPKKKERISDEIIETDTGNYHYQKLLYEVEAKRKEAAARYLDEMIEKMVSTRTVMFHDLNVRREEEIERSERRRREKEIELLKEWSLGDEAAQKRLKEEEKRHADRMQLIQERKIQLERLASEIKETAKVDVQPEPTLQKLDTEQPRPVHHNMTQPEPQIVTQPKPQIVTQPKPQIVTQPEPQIVTQPEPQIVTQPKPQIVTQPEPQIVTRPEPKIAAQPDSLTLNYCSATSFKEYSEAIQFRASYEAGCAPFSNDSTTKRFRVDLKKAVNIPVNAISSQSQSRLREKYDTLARLLSGERVTVADVTVAASQHVGGVAFCTVTLAKQIVKQGEVLISCNPEAAFPLAMVVVALWNKFPDLARLTRAYFYDACPYVIPMFPPQTLGQTDKDFYKSRGYNYENGVVEKQDVFLKRMSGIFRLYAAIWVTKPAVVARHPWGLAQGWRWLAAFLNLKPEMDVSASFLYDFLTVCGSEFYRTYKRHFNKILYILASDYLAKLDEIDEGGPKTRLEVYLEEIQKRGNITSPKGFLPPNTW